MPIQPAGHNPDDELCDDCYISDVEKVMIKDAAEEMSVYEGLHVDDTLVLYPGFLMRGSCHRFIHQLNTRMRKFRWKMRNGTKFELESGEEHSEGLLVEKESSKKMGL